MSVYTILLVNSYVKDCFCSLLCYILVTDTPRLTAHWKMNNFVNQLKCPIIWHLFRKFSEVLAANVHT